MTAPKISVVMYTARDDHPFDGRLDWHCFDPVVKTLAAQTFKNFELVLVDMHWETRPDWFERNPQSFPVKHVPSSPNYWQQRKRTGLCAQINRGFTWADGELVWMCGENNMFPRKFLETAWRIHKSGHVPVAWYAVCGLDAGAPHPECPGEFDVLGFTRNHVREMDHRAKPFVADPTLQVSPCHHQNYFGYSGVPTEAALEINGFDELFDGQWGLFDCDFGSRLDLAGYKMLHSRDLFVVEPPVVPGGYAGIGHHEAFKCHYAIYLHNRASRRKVNMPLASDYIEQVKRATCHGECVLKQRCAEGSGKDRSEYTVGESLYYPFCEGENSSLAKGLFAKPPVRDLRAESADRRAHRSPYDRGFFDGVAHWRR